MFVFFRHIISAIQNCHHFWKIIVKDTFVKRQFSHFLNFFRCGIYKMQLSYEQFQSIKEGILNIRE